MPDLTGRIEGEKMGLFGKKKVEFCVPGRRQTDEYYRSGRSCLFF